MKPAIVRIWIILLLLSVAGYLLADNRLPGQGAVGASWASMAILGLAALKFGAVAWWFMELRRAARIWPAALFVLLAVLLGVVLVV